MKLFHPEAPPSTNALSAADLEAWFRSQCKVEGAGDCPQRLLIAVSGGADSLALLLLASGLPKSRFDVSAATVDHGLRPEAPDEAAYVKEICALLGVPHETLVWQGWNGTGNLQASARAARYRLLADEAYRLGARIVLTAHHRTDQIETVLHALDRGDRPHRRAGMRPIRDYEPGLKLARPLLDERPERLRKTLFDAGIAAVDDPSNSDPRFARVRHRQNIAAMTAPEIETILAVQREAAHHRNGSERKQADLMTAMLKEGQLDFDAETGSVALAYAGFRALSDDLAADLIARILRAVGGSARPAGRAAITRLLEPLKNGHDARTATLGGVDIRSGAGAILFQREYGRAGPPNIAVPWCLPRLVFDERFDIELSAEDRRLAEARNAALAPYGATGRGNARHRTMPALIATDGTVLVATAELAKRERYRGINAQPFGRLRCRVRWRCLADLPIKPAENGTR
ncbi:tRNA lysidine(34) synthetase TilS [Fulvimarina sp. MAC3]|uniref:tRNA lysidine(34) synthetase TilS n=1 Tax=Fulvimarina sp. MAC3 TaxID=3148887 RepID=UPI0031FBFAA1